MLGKVIGGGMPVAAFGGRREIMEKIAPCGPVYQAGTLSGNPVAVACGMATLKKIQAPGFYDRLGAQTKRLVEGLQAAAQAAGVLLHRRQCRRYVWSLLPAAASSGLCRRNEGRQKCLQHVLSRHARPRPLLCAVHFEAGFVSITHTDEVIDKTIADAREVFTSMAK